MRPAPDAVSREVELSSEIDPLLVNAAVVSVPVGTSMAPLLVSAVEIVPLPVIEPSELLMSDAPVVVLMKPPFRSISPSLLRFDPEAS